MLSLAMGTTGVPVRGHWASQRRVTAAGNGDPGEGPGTVGIQRELWLGNAGILAQ